MDVWSHGHQNYVKDAIEVSKNHQDSAGTGLLPSPLGKPGPSPLEAFRGDDAHHRQTVHDQHPVSLAVSEIGRLWSRAAPGVKDTTGVAVTSPTIWHRRLRRQPPLLPS